MRTHTMIRISTSLLLLGAVALMISGCGGHAQTSAVAGAPDSAAQTILQQAKQNAAAQVAYQKNRAAMTAQARTSNP